MINKKVITPSVNMLSAGTIVNGNITIDGDFRIDGSLIGDVQCKGKLTVGSTGSIEGKIDCQNAEISGEIKGEIKATELIIFKETSKITGDISTVKLMIEPGAKLTITCRTTEI